LVCKSSKKFFIIIIILLTMLYSNLSSAWRSYDIYRNGAKGIAMGGAFAGIADDVSAIYFNPAGLVHQKKFSLFYTMDSQILLINPIDPSIKLTYKVPALLGFVFPLNNKKLMVAGFAINSPFQRKIPDEFAVYNFSPVFSFLLLKNLALGIKIGFNYATYSGTGTSNGYGYNYQVGMLYFYSKNLRIGLNYQGKNFIYWPHHGETFNVKENFPDILTIGTGYLLAKNAILSFDIEYQNWKGINYIEENKNTTPTINNGLFKTIHPHLGFSFLEKNSGAHIRTGLYTDSFLQYVNQKVKNDTQILWTIGIGGEALKVIKVEASIADSYLLHFINKRNNQIETVQITVEYQF